MSRPQSNSQGEPIPGSNVRLSTEAVIASYIHAISGRHGHAETTAEEPSRPPERD